MRHKNMLHEAVEQPGLVEETSRWPSCLDVRFRAQGRPAQGRQSRQENQRARRPPERRHGFCFRSPGSTRGSSTYCDGAFCAPSFMRYQMTPSGVIVLFVQFLAVIARRAPSSKDLPCCNISSKHAFIKPLINKTFLDGTNRQKSSSARESHPHALTDPDVNLSIHPAPIVQPWTPWPSVRIGGAVET